MLKQLKSQCILALLLIISSCTPKGKIAPQTQSIEDYYGSLGSNIKRLIEMRKGNYVQYKDIYLPDSTIQLKPWMPNDDDSLIYVSKPLIKERKQEYWLSTYAFFSSNPTVPIFVIFEKFTTFSGRGVVDNKNLAKANYNFEDIELSKLKNLNKGTTWTRISLLEFKGETDPIKMKNKNKTFYQKRYLKITPKRCLNQLVYMQDLKEGSPEKKNKAIQYLLYLSDEKLEKLLSAYKEE
jgi:hypothetical protein